METEEAFSAALKDLQSVDAGEDARSDDSDSDFEDRRSKGMRGAGAGRKLSSDVIGHALEAFQAARQEVLTEREPAERALLQIHLKAIQRRLKHRLTSARTPLPPLVLGVTLEGIISRNRSWQSKIQMAEVQIKALRRKLRKLEKQKAAK